MDIVASETEQTAVVFRNNEDKVENNNFIRFKLTGTDKNLNAIGTKIYIYTKSGMQMNQHHVVRGYQSTSETWFILVWVKTIPVYQSGRDLAR
jgi:hypothetical protein